MTLTPADALTMLGVVATAVLLILAPAVAVWRPRLTPGGGWRRWSAPLVSLIAPAALAYLRW